MSDKSDVEKLTEALNAFLARDKIGAALLEVLVKIEANTKAISEKLDTQKFYSGPAVTAETDPGEKELEGPIKPKVGNVMRGLPENLRALVKLTVEEGKIFVAQNNWIQNKNTWMQLNQFFKAKGFEWVPARESPTEFGHWEGWEQV